MSDFLETKLWIDSFSEGKHICCSCIHAKEIPDGYIGGTTIDYNWCPVITSQEDFNYHKYIETVDNGGGYWITKCKFYEFDKDWKKVKYHDYIKSDKWKAKRLECLKRDNYQCQKCGTAKNLVIHHWTYDRLGNEDLGDIVTLCKNCHKKVHENDLSGRETDEQS